MALTERSRSALYQGLGAIIEDEEAVGEMLSYFPTRDVEEPVTKEHLRAEMALLRADIADLRGEMAGMATKAALRDLDRRMTTGFADSDQRMTAGFAEMASLRGEMTAMATKAALGDLDRRMTAGFAETHRLIEARARETQRWMIGTMIALMAVVVGALTALS